MKKLILSVVVILTSVIKLCSQEYIQQAEIEIKDNLDSDKTYVCEASSHVKLLPGFQYSPESDNDMNIIVDKYYVFPPEDGYYGGNSGIYSADPDAVVGSLPATFGVNNMGAAVYSIDLKLPQAVGTIMPSLSLVYNNQSGNGLMGWSWDLGGLSVISRVGQTEYHDGKVTSVDFVNDRYVVDGQRLFALDNAKYGANGTVYKTEVDNMDKIISYTEGYNSPKYFEVWKSNGQKWEYGTTQDSRMEPQNVQKKVFKWFLNKMSDRDGNSVLFHYDINNVTGESYIDNIEYTVNEENGLRAAYKVVFKYDTERKDAWSGYVAGMTVSCKRLLKNILVLKGDSQKVLFDYSFNYDAPGYYDGKYHLHYKLNSVGLTVGDEKINPTRIVWNKKNKHYPQSQGYQISELDKQTFTDLPFVGDFNGDGLSDVITVPYKIQDTYPNPIKAEVYINNGDGTFKKDPLTTLKLPKELDWIYVMDMNNDGKDDVVTYEYNYDYEKGDDVLTTLNLYLLQNDTFVKTASYSYNDNISITPGKYIFNDNIGMIVFTMGNYGEEEITADYIYYANNAFLKKTVGNMSSFDDKELSYMALDVTGDGVMELISSDDSGSRVHRLVRSSTNAYSLEHYTNISSLTKESYLFPNDFNGDGRTDILYYDARTRWNIILSKGNGFTAPMSCVNTNLFRNVTLNSKDKYTCSLKQMAEPTVAIRTADFDGDGISDVALFKNFAGNYHMEVGFMPYKKDDNTYDFMCQDRFHIPMNYSHQTIHIGRFLPQENVSLISSLSKKPYPTEKAYVVSLYPNSAIYSVERIIDGLGNTRGLCYDYLMNKSSSVFYTSDNSSVGNNMRKISLPLKAVKADTIYSTNNKPIITTYEYNNAVVHMKGHGFLAFEKTVTRTLVNNECLVKKIQETEFNTMGKYCMTLPASTKLFQGETQLIKETMPTYRKYSCTSNSKVFLPVLVDNHEVKYDYDKSGQMLKKTIMSYEYKSDNGSRDTYDKVIQLYRNAVGHSADASSETVDDCSFKEETVTEYANDFNSWVINRPTMKKHIVEDQDDGTIGNMEIYTYYDNHPLRIKSVSKIPNKEGDTSDSLSLHVDYEYDDFGHVVKQTITSPSLKNEKVQRYEYADTYQYRYCTKTIDELGNEISCVYDNDYGTLAQTVDYNQFVTESTKDPLGIDDVVVLSDGMRVVRSLRWSDGNEYAPGNASYYVWNKNSGNAETMVFYHKNGAELRTVSFDINGNAIFQDKTYDDIGNIVQETLPYYKGDNKIVVRSHYDKYDRLVMTEYPNGLICQISYDGNKIVTKQSSNEGGEKTKTDEYNVKGWLVNTTDVGGNRISYDYYGDGLIKSARINNNENTKVIVGYDNNRNRNSMSDPNYGTIRYVNDALGNVVKIIANNGDEIEFEYDAIGRKLSRKELEKSSNYETVTRWVYDDKRGQKGLLKKVYNESHSVEYFYDDKLRLINVVEIIDDTEYNTEYTYDKANRIASVTYPTGLTLLKTYSDSGFEQMCYDKENETLLWKAVSTNAMGAITEYHLGDGTKTVKSYDPYTSLVNSIYTSKDDNILQDISYEYDAFGNMVSRSKETGTFVEELFEYDKYDRLISISLNGKVVETMTYDDMGNIVRKEHEDVNVLYDVVYDRKNPYSAIEMKTDAESLFPGVKQKIGYSLSNDVVKVACDEKYMSVEYGVDKNRVFMEIDNGKYKYSKTYVGNSEFVNDEKGRNSCTYLVGPMGVYGAYVFDEKGDKTVSYIHKDNLDSWNVITDESGDVVQELSFDAWGNMRNPDDWHGKPTENRLMFDRGFTGHEHLNDFGLINMNGRMYDPVLSTMISPDNNIQMPQSSQNFNRYSYCLNNPLNYKDPTGEWVESLLMGIAVGASNVVFNADKVDSFKEGLLLFGAGFVQGFLTEYTMGQSWFWQVGAGALTSSLTSGVNEFVSVSDGSFDLSGDDWNAVVDAACYGLGSGLTKSVFNSYIHAPTEEDCGFKLHYLFYDHDEVAHAVTSMMAHGMGCWFSGQPLLENVKLSNFGLDLEMLGIVANRLLSMYIYKSDFADDVIEQRAQDIKKRMMDDILSENPEHGDFSVTSKMTYVEVYAGRVYIHGDIKAKLPGEIFSVMPYQWMKEFEKPYLDEVVSFPFSYSLFRTLFFDN